MTLSEEDYVKAIYHLGKEQSAPVSTNAIADQMSTKPSSVTDMMIKLAEKGLVNHKKYHGVTLTDNGKAIALSIIRKHRLWEVFLVDKLHFSWDEVHEVAEQLEHIKSEKLINHLDKYLGFPEVDPHGDPIPSKKGEMKKTVKKLLIELPAKSIGICVGVKDTSQAFLRFLDKNGIALGDTISVLDREEFDGSMQIAINGIEIHISQQIAANLFLKIPE
ncbi:MAG: metal-dependent transcriptional regulator [Flavobacteriales bacterium]|nr:MAG: metal-dependent transcriptional regulator [Flavobacteriales bacterium]